MFPKQKGKNPLHRLQKIVYSLATNILEPIDSMDCVFFVLFCFFFIHLRLNNKLSSISLA